MSTQATSNPEDVQQKDLYTGSAQASSSGTAHKEDFQTGDTDQDLIYDQPSSATFNDQSLAGALSHPPELDDLDFPNRQPSDTELSDELDSEEGELSSDAAEKPEQTEDMNYRETVWSIQSFMGSNHKPTFEKDLSDPGSERTRSYQPGFL